MAAADEVERLREQIAAGKLAGLRADRAEILTELDAATGDDVAFLEGQLDDVDAQIAVLLERCGRALGERQRTRARSAPPDATGTLF
ncbi:Uncharacterised protein [Nocardia otitidiscaviarum]|uniref:Uncharacterized protein n=1 Tax=Nocardia otitidiscaviarum TaxID=1823 RepID=A0A379JM82_9NOCA|nr:hypothetical protein [Nocardia otitidiscaviarum]SUD49512.1 Uncharacterised protein [Nocardia otitidiscaviarum]SUD49608.1 Uncharacterised protein [Nocardia otitidiscaviarum]